MPVFVCRGPMDIVLDAATNAWVTAVTGAGGTVSDGRKIIVDALIKNLKTDGVFSKLDRLWLFAAENTQSALVDVVSAHTATAVNAPSFTTDRGYTSDGTTSYVDTGYNAATSGVQYTLNAASAGVWVITNRAVSSAFDFGIQSSTDYTTVLMFTGSNTQDSVINESTANDHLSTVSDSTGFGMVARTASNAGASYRNGLSLGTIASTSTAIPSLNFYVCCRNINGTAQAFITDQIAANMYGGGLNATDAANLYARLRSYMTSVGVP